MWTTQITALAILAGCDDKDTTFEDLSGDTGTSSDAPTRSTDCYQQSESARFDLNADGDWDACSTYSNKVSIIDAMNAEVTNVTVYGYGDSLLPEDYVPIRAWELTVPTGAGSVWQAYPYDQMETADGTAYEAADSSSTWHTSFGGSDVAAFNDCAPDCSYYSVGTEIVDPLTAMADSCSLYDDNTADDIGTGLAVCLTLEFTASEPPPPPGAPCSAGHGRFGLVPLRYQDLDGDGKLAVVWKPMMETGRGTLTGDALISKMKVVDDHGVPLQVVARDETYSFGDDDSLVVAARGSTTLSDRRATSFRHAAPSSTFVSVGYPQSEDLDLEIDMAWNCPLAISGGEPVALAQGYTFALSDVGCDLYGPQKITMRPVPADDPAYVALTPYGTNGNDLKVPLRRNDDPDGKGRWYFEYDERGFEVSGSIGEHSAHHGADVIFDTIRFLGTDQCATGAYTFAKEY